VFSRAALAACLLVLLAHCGPRDRVAPQLAILRFENLSGDASLDWMGRAFSEILCGELEGSPERRVIQWRALHAFDAAFGARPASAPGISAERAGALAAGANEILYGDFSVADGVLRATAVEEDLRTRKMVRVISAGGPLRDGVLPVANAIARQLGGAHAFGTRHPEALRAYVAALEPPDPAAALRSFSQAAAADPDFGRAYVFWLDAALAQRNRAEAEGVLRQAGAHMDRFPELDRARLRLGAALLTGDFNARLQALGALARLDPADPDTHRALAESLMSVRQYDAAVTEFRRALALRPEDILSLNSMGYAAAYSGDLPTAIRALRGYERLRPGEPNPLDSLGDVHFVLGHYSEAEQFYLAARAKAPGFLSGGEYLKAAQARLMTGDVPGATEIFNRYLAERRASHDPFAEFQAAAWSWQTGARRAAIQRLDTLARAGESGTPRELAARAGAQAALWLLELGDRSGAAERARQAVAQAGPATAEAVSLVSLLTQPEASAAEWTERAARAFPEPAQSAARDYARAYALLFAKQFQPAAQVLREIYRRPTSDLDDGMAVLLAWTYMETGQWTEAEPLLKLNPLPQAAGLPMFGSLHFPRIFFLRGALLEKLGQPQEAARNYRLFLSLSGPDAQIWGEEQRARR
jgi:tetratricopeptide (TPR) repeat protein